MEDQHGFFQNIKSVQLEETKKVESQCVRDEEGRLLRKKGCIRERWVPFFRSLLNAKSHMLDPDIPERLPKQPVARAIEIEPTEEDIATAMKAMSNAKVGRAGTPAELLKLGLHQDRTILLSYLRVYFVTSSFTRGCSGGFVCGLSQSSWCPGSSISGSLGRGSSFRGFMRLGPSCPILLSSGVFTRSSSDVEFLGWGSRCLIAMMGGVPAP